MNNDLWINKKDNKPMYIFMGVVFFIMVSLVSLHISHEMSAGTDFLPAISQALDNVLSNPFGFLPITFSSLKAWGTGLIIYVIACLWFYVENEKNKRDAINKENGSASFVNSLKEYNETYVSPHRDKKKSGLPNINDLKKKKPDNNNIILTDDVMLSLNASKTRLNVNVMVIGGSGSGKSRFYVKPNLLQANTSYVITDPAGELLETMGTFLEEKGYKVQVFNLTDMQHSCCYNPFDYVRNTEGIPMLVNCLIKNTTPGGSSKGDPFWEKSETALLSSLFSYLIEVYPGQRNLCNFTSVMKLLRFAEVDENNPSAESTLDKLMKNLEKVNPLSMAVKDYKTFKMGAGKTLKSILISCAVRLHVFDLPGVANLIRTDMEHSENNLDLSKIGDEKTALFIIIPAADDTYSFIVSMLYYQMFETLYYKAENIMPKSYIIKAQDGSKLTVRTSRKDAENLIENYKKASIEKRTRTIKVLNDDNEEEDKTLESYAIVCPSSDYDDGKKVLWESPFEKTSKMMLEKYRSAEAIKGVNLLGASGKTVANHVHFLLDEFGNIGQIPDFDKKLATMRKYELSCSIILQNLAQLKELYDKKAEGLIGNCDEILFLGSSEYETCEYFSKKLGDTTITVRNNSRSLGGSKGGGGNYSFNKSARKLLTPDEVSLVQKECLLFIRGMRPFFRKKYNYGPKHPNYKYTGDADKSRIYYCSEHFNNEMKPQTSISASEEDKIVSKEYKNNPELLKSNQNEDDGVDSAEIIRLDEEAESELSEMMSLAMGAANKNNSSKISSKNKKDSSDKKQKNLIPMEDAEEDDDNVMFYSTTA